MIRFAQDVLVFLVGRLELKSVVTGMAQWTHCLWPSLVTYKCPELRFWVRLWVRVRARGRGRNAAQQDLHERESKHSKKAPSRPIPSTLNPNMKKTLPIVSSDQKNTKPVIVHINQPPEVNSEG